MSTCDIIPVLENGNTSILFKDLLDYHNNDRSKVMSDYEYAHSDRFIAKHGDWIEKKLKGTDENGEPDISLVVAQYSASPKTMKTKEKVENAKKRVIAVKKRQVSLLRDLNDKLKAFIAENPSSSKRKDIEAVISRNNTRIKDLRKKQGTINDKIQLDFVVNESLEDLDYLKNIADKGFSSNYLMFAYDVIRFWKAATNTSEVENPIFTKSDLDGNTLIKDIHQQYEDLYSDLEERIREEVLKIVNKYSSREGTLTDKEILQSIKDIGFMSHNALDIAHVDHPITQAVYAMVKTMNSNARREGSFIFENLDSLMKGVSYSDQLMIFEKDSNGNYTSNYVRPYTLEYYEKLKQARQDGTWNDFAKNDLDIIDMRYMVIDDDPDIEDEFRFTNATKEEIQKYRDQLKSRIGDSLFTQIDKEVKRKYNQFKSLRYQKYEESKLESGELSKFKMQQFNKYNSPFQFAERYSSPKKTGKFISYDVVTFIPKNEKYFSDQYRKVQNNPKIRELYNKTISIMNEMNAIFPGKQEEFASLPFVKKKLVEEMFQSEGGMLSNVHLMDRMLDQFREGDEAQDVGTNIDLQTGEEIRKLSISNTQTIKETINRRYEELLKGEQRKLDDSIRQELKDQAREEVMKDTSMDLNKILKMYSMAALMYKHKAGMEDTVRMMRNFFSEQINIDPVTPSGKQKTSEGQEYGTKAANSRIAESFDYFVNSVYYGDNRKKVEMPTKEKKLTTKEKVRVKRLEDKRNKIKSVVDEIDEISNKNRKSNEDKNRLSELNTELKELELTKKEAYDEIDDLDKSINSIGKYVTASATFDEILKFFQVKTMGWNLPAGISNMAFGYIANIVESDPRDYSEESIRKAYHMVFISEFKRPINNKLKTKIEALMHHYDVLKKSSEEVYKRGQKGWWGEKLRRLNPFYIQDKTEYFNQAPIMIAMMMDRKIDLTTGELSEDGDVTIWDLYGENGRIKDEYRNDAIIASWESLRSDVFSQGDKFKLNIDKKVSRNHGNYDSDRPLKGKEVAVGRALFQFRTWMFEGWNSRWEEYKFDDSLGHDVKGRYRTGFLAFNRELKTEDGSEIAMSRLQGTLFQIKQTAMRLVFLRNKVEAGYAELAGDGVGELDIINMRRNMLETLQYLKIMLAMTAIGIVYGDDDDEGISKNVMIGMYNQTLRIRQDILFYINPGEAYRIINDPVAILGLYEDYGRLISDATRTMTGAVEPTLQSGPYEGMDRNKRNLMKVVPFLTQLIRLKSVTHKAYDGY